MPKAGGAATSNAATSNAATSNKAFPSVAGRAVITPRPLAGSLLRSTGPPIPPLASARTSPPAIAMEASGATALRLASGRNTVPRKTVPQKTVPRKTVPQKTVPQKTVPTKTVPTKTVPTKTRALLPTGRRGPRSDVRSHEQPSGTVQFVLSRGTRDWLPMRKSPTREGRSDVATGRTAPVGATGLRSSSFSLRPAPSGPKIAPAATATERVAVSRLLRATKPVHPGSETAPVMGPLVMPLARFHRRLADLRTGASISGASFSGASFSGPTGVGTDVVGRRGPRAGERGAKDGGQSVVSTRLQRDGTSSAPVGPLNPAQALPYPGGFPGPAFLTSPPRGKVTPLLPTVEGWARCHFRWRSDPHQYPACPLVVPAHTQLSRLILPTGKPDIHA